MSNNMHSILNSKYPEILIDKRNNSPNNTLYITLSMEQYYDLLHHTHTAESIEGLTTSGEVIPQEVYDTIKNLQDEIKSLKERISELENNRIIVGE